MAASKSGPVIDTPTPGAPAPALWEVYRCKFNAGPIIMLGPRNQLRHVTVNNQNDPLDQGPNAGFAKIRCEGGASANVTMLNPNVNLKFENDTDSTPNVNAQVVSPNRVVVEGNRPMFINHVVPSDRGVYRIGGYRDSPSTQLGLQIHTSAPRFPEEGCMVIADGTKFRNMV